ncbi:MAG: hypothetical protein WA057_01145 [Candidatus Magasanikiibacteriota bacterium]
MTKKKITGIIDFEEMLRSGLPDHPFFDSSEVIVEKPSDKGYTFRNKIYQKFLLLQENEDFLKGVSMLRKKWRVPVEIPDKEFDNFDKDIDKFRKKFKLSKPYHQLVSNYVQNKKINIDSLKLLINFDDFIITSKSREEQYILLKIYPEMTIDDVRELWRNISHVRSKYLGNEAKRANNRPQLVRDKYILDLKRKKYKHFEIAKLTNAKFGSNLSYQDISKILQRLLKVASKKS